MVAVNVRYVVERLNKNGSARRYWVRPGYDTARLPEIGWVEKAGQRRRRFYKLTAAGQKILAQQRKTWKEFFAALDHVAGINPA